VRAVSFALHVSARLSCALELNPKPQVVAAQMVVAPPVWADVASAFASWRVSVSPCEAGRKSTRTGKHDVGINGQRWRRVESPRRPASLAVRRRARYAAGGRRWRLRWPRGRWLRRPRLQHGDAILVVLMSASPICLGLD
jgi:hypothetical protein